MQEMIMKYLRRINENNKDSILNDIDLIEDFRDNLESTYPKALFSISIFGGQLLVSNGLEDFADKVNDYKNDIPTINYGIEIKIEGFEVLNQSNKSQWTSFDSDSVIPFIEETFLSRLNHFDLELRNFVVNLDFRYRKNFESGKFKEQEIKKMVVRIDLINKKANR